MLQTLHISSIDVTQIYNLTNKDPILDKVKTPLELQPHWLRKGELSVHDGCVFIGSQVVIPDVARTEMLDQLHQGHPGITRMKGLGKSFVS